MKRHNHRTGQTTIFIIIAITVVVIFSILLSQRDRHAVGSESPAPEESLASARATAQDCLERSAKEAIQDIGHGGRIEMRNPLQLYDGTIDAMAIDGTPYLPTIDQLAKEASAQIDYATGECFGQAMSTNPRLAKVKIGTVQTTVTFGDEHASVAASIPLQTTSLADTSTTEGFAATVPVRMPLILETAQTLVTEAQDDPTRISPELLFAQPVRIILETAGQDLFLYRLIDDKSIIDKEPFEYRLAIKTTGEAR